MSNVLAKDRKPSVVQYVETARKLVVHTVSYARKFPKSLMFLFTKDIVAAAREVYTNVVVANSIVPKKGEAFKIRFNHLMEAKGKLDVLDGLLSIAVEMYESQLLPHEEVKISADGTKHITKCGISEYGWVHWGELIEEEKKLIQGVLASDAKNIKGCVL